MRPNFNVPGHAIEGPAKPSTSENGLPINLKSIGNSDDMTIVKYYPFSKDGSVRPPAAKPSGRAGQDKDGDDISVAP
eukprot:7861572-Pyramimonas_sp.AAC.1